MNLGFNLLMGMAAIDAIEKGNELQRQNLLLQQSKEFNSKESSREKFGSRQNSAVDTKKLAEEIVMAEERAKLQKTISEYEQEEIGKLNKIASFKGKPYWWPDLSAIEQKEMKVLVELLEKEKICFSEYTDKYFKVRIFPPNETISSFYILVGEQAFEATLVTKYLAQFNWELKSRIWRERLGEEIYLIVSKELINQIEEAKIIKRVKCIKTGEIYSSIIAASIYTETSSRFIYHDCQSGLCSFKEGTSAGGYWWEYVE